MDQIECLWPGKWNVISPTGTSQTDGFPKAILDLGIINGLSA